MGTPNSQVGFYTELLSELLSDNPLSTQSARSVQRDIATLKSRASEEGLGFLTKTLPKLGKALDRGLTSMRFCIPSGFKTAKDASIPAFMQECFKRIFDRDGFILDQADPAAISHVRQVCFLFYKLELPPDADAQARVIEQFVATEEELHLSEDTYAGEEFLAAAYIIRDAFRGFNHEDIVPRHGPGSVATGERLDEKWNFSRLYKAIHRVYPYHEYFMVGGERELIDRLDWFDSFKQLETGCAKVVLVPKDSRGPRLISCEPLEYQWIQQGLGRKIIRHLESSRITGGQVNFTNQEVNRQLALQSSKTGEFATLDLKDASDRVSLRLVRSLFRFCPELLSALEATRTTHTKLPDGRVVPLAKFAPMGSALCFPIEAICFWALCVSAISRSARIRPSVIGKDVFVYGDDIIIPTKYADACTQCLARAGLVVNADKSCVSGFFRESCGMDAYKGVPVTPLRWKTPWSAKSTDGSCYVSAVALANSFASRGYISVADFVWKALERAFGRVPYGTSTSPFPCRIIPRADLAERVNALSFRTRWNDSFQRFEFFVRRVHSRRVQTVLDGWKRLLRNLVYGFEETEPSVIVVPRSMKIKRGWMPV